MGRIPRGMASDESRKREPELVRLGVYDTEFQAGLTRERLAQEDAGYLYWVKRYRKKWAVYFVKQKMPVVKFEKMVADEIRNLERGR